MREVFVMVPDVLTGFVMAPVDKRGMAKRLLREEEMAPVKVREVIIKMSTKMAYVITVKIGSKGICV